MMGLEDQKSGRRRPEQRQQADFSRDITLLYNQADHRTRLIIRLLWQAGLTPRELVSLQRRDLDTHARLLTIRPETTKHGTGREVKLSPSLTHALHTHTARKQPRDHVFSTRQSPQLTTRRVEQLVKHASKKASLDYTPRDLRNAYLRTAATAAKDDRHLKQLTGLKTITKRAVLDKDQRDTLEHALESRPARTRGLIRLLLETGADLNDILNLRKHDLEGRQLTLDQDTITISPRLARDLERLAAQTDTHLFRTRQSTQLTARRAEQLIGDTGKRAGIRGLTPRLLRNTARHGGAP